MLEDNFGDIVGKARFGKGWSPPELARRSKLSEGRIASIEEGAAPSAAEVDLLARALGLDPQKLLTIAEGAWEPKPIRGDWARWIERIDGRIGSYPVNGYLLIDTEKREGALFDTGCSPDRVLRILKDRQIRLSALCVTHGHPDHIGGADAIHAATDAPIYLHPDELSGGARPSSKGIVLLQEGMKISAGRFKIGFFRTPGHTPGGTTFFVEAKAPAAFVGDALFAGSLGRAQASSTYPLLLRSVRDAILSLPKETALFPGHGPATTVEEERARNPFFVGAD
ncbi:MAG TPA: MBL fold metallo-hydrolase [Candidatus Manganitrophaceae bacterium]|nr:MBL fold metallo-hydrolase [Candidatus Manganitrophaceae bacterium]